MELTGLVMTRPLPATTVPFSLKVDDEQMTNVAGLYAAGDFVSDLHQLALPWGRRAIAATAYITPRQINPIRDRLNAASLD